MTARKLFSLNLRYMRTHKEMSIQDLSVDLDVQVSRYRMWEAGKAVPNCELLIVISDYYMVPLDIIFRVNIAESKDLIF